MKTKTKKAAAKAEAMDTATLVDEIGGMIATIAVFEKRKKELVTELLDRAGNRHYVDGHLYTATIVAEHPVMSLDMDRVRAELGEEKVIELSVETMRKASVRVTARKKPDQKEEPKARKPGQPYKPDGNKYP